MGNRVDLPDGQWAELLDPKKVKERARRQYILAMSEFNKARAAAGNDVAQYGAEHQQLLDDGLDLLIVCLVSAWSFEAPVSVEALADLSTDMFDPIKAACVALAGEVMPDYSPTTDPKATTAA